MQVQPRVKAPMPPGAPPNALILKAFPALRHTAETMTLCPPHLLLTVVDACWVPMRLAEKEPRREKALSANVVQRFVPCLSYHTPLS